MRHSQCSCAQRRTGLPRPLCSGSFGPAGEMGSNDGPAEGVIQAEAKTPKERAAALAATSRGADGGLPELDSEGRAGVLWKAGVPHAAS